jgi:hypothetical protein
MKIKSSQKFALLLFPTISALALLSLIFSPTLHDNAYASKQRKVEDRRRQRKLTLQVQKSEKLKAQAKALKHKVNLEQLAKNESNEAKRTNAPLRRHQKQNRSKKTINIALTNKTQSRRLQAEKQKSKRQKKRLKKNSRSAPTLNNSTNQLLSQSNQITEENNESEEDEVEDDETPSLGPTLETLITGKLMSHHSRKGIPGATVTLLVFHPLSAVSASPVWITPTTITTNNNGVFSLTLQVPENPAPGAILGLAFTDSTHQPLAGVPITNLIPGRPQNIGIFWMRKDQRKLEGTITPAHLGENAQIIDTGGLNPLAWDARLRNAILQLFPSYPINSDLYSLSIAKQAPEHNSHRWISLLSNASWVSSQNAQWKKVPVEIDGQTKEETIAFANFTIGPDTSLNGSVSAKNGGALPGAVVTAISSASEPDQTSITRTNGDFRFPNPPLKIHTIRVSHNEFITQDFAANSNDSSPILILEFKRPDIQILLTNSISSEPIPNIKITLKGQTIKGQPTPQQTLQSQNPNGNYRLTAAFPIHQISFEREGFFKLDLDKPDNFPTQPIAVPMLEARTLTFTARQAIGKNDRWTEHEESSYVTNWSGRFLEFEIEYGEELSAFDLEMGVRNHGIIDNKYKFDVRVDIPDDPAKHVYILASKTDTQVGRTPLPPHSGTRKIRLTWMNDRWIKNQLDANIIIDWVKFHQRPLTALEKTQVETQQN